MTQKKQVLCGLQGIFYYSTVKLPGFNDVVVSINESSADVVVSNTQVSDAERAQIEDIVKRKTGIEAANITITPVTAAE